MKIDDQIQCKFPRISNGSRRLDSTKLGLNHKMDNQYGDEEDEGDNKRGAAAGGGVDFGGGIGRFYGWPSSRIVRVSRASGGKDRHSKVLTSKGLRDRRVRLSVNTAIQFYDLQDRLGYDQPSKAVEWLLKAAESSIAELPPMNTPFPDTPKQMSHEKRSDQLGFDSAETDLDGGDRNYSQQQVTKSSAGSSNSENSKGSGLSLSRSENRIKARERAKERVAEKENEQTQLNPISHTTSFTELLSCGISNNSSAPMNYFTSGVLATPFTTAAPPPLFSVSTDHQSELQHYSFVPDHFVPVAAAAAANSSSRHHHHHHHHHHNAEYNLNFTISSANSSGFASFNRGTLQSNSTSPLLPHFQRYSDGPTPSFFIADSHHQFLSGYYGDAHCRKDKN